MRVAVIQPPYPRAGAETPESVIGFMLREIEHTTDTHDLIVLPEYANCPGAGTIDDIEILVGEDHPGVLGAIAELARIKHSNIAVNLVLRENGEIGNVTVLVDQNGSELARYCKTHLTHTETQVLGLEPGNRTVVCEMEGVRVAFATCFDIYFPEYMETIASYRPDILILPSYQRSEDCDVIRRQSAGRALDMEAFIIRASYSMGERSDKGGCSMVVSPAGEILLDACQDVGMFSCEIDPKAKRLRPEAHGLPEASSREIIDKYRRPDLYQRAR
jgi:predicted amidohydrolase